MFRASSEREPNPGEAYGSRALAKLSRPNIVAVHDSGRTDNLCYLIMEDVEGLNLRQVMQAGQVGPEEALAIVPQAPSSPIRVGAVSRVQLVNRWRDNFFVLAKVRYSGHFSGDYTPSVLDRPIPKKRNGLPTASWDGEPTLSRSYARVWDYRASIVADEFASSTRQPHCAPSEGHRVLVGLARCVRQPASRY